MLWPLVIGGASVRRAVRAASDDGQSMAQWRWRHVPEAYQGTVAEADVRELRTRLRGPLIGPSDEPYEAARAVYNGMIDKRPALIARCVDVADVVGALGFAREHKLKVAIRGGGHSGPGLGMCDDGLVVDLSSMKGVFVDAATARSGSLAAARGAR